MTPYQYVNNNPIMFTDPTGMEAETSDSIVPRIVFADSRGNVTSKDNRFSKNLSIAVKAFMSTNIGNEYIRSFMKKGENFLGYTAKENGKFSKYDLRIWDMNLKTKEDRGA